MNKATYRKGTGRVPWPGSGIGNPGHAKMKTASRRDNRRRSKLELRYEIDDYLEDEWFWNPEL